MSTFPAFKYFVLTIKHKYYVFLAGLKLKVPIWRLIIHDWSKFTPSELFAYGRQFFGDQGDPLGFTEAWNHHQKSNRHHWEYWIVESGHNRGGYIDGSILPMHEKYTREMVADWLGATKAYEGKWPKGEWPWLEKKWQRIRLHPVTRCLIIKILAEIDIFPDSHNFSSNN